MRKRPAPIEVSEESILFFRDRRAHLAGPGAESTRAAAREIVGAQAQQEAPALLALSLRTRGRPTAAAVKAQLVEDGSRCLVRTWGQRDTLHLYDPDDWATVIAARSEWPRSGRRGLMPVDAELEAPRRRFEAAEGPLLRADLFDLAPPRLVEEAAEHPGVAGSPERFAVARLVWCLAMEGSVAMADKLGAEQRYVHRKSWFPDLEWPDDLDPRACATRLARRYLAAHGPATPADVAHFFGARVATARRWIEGLRPGLVEVSCHGRDGLLALEEDLEELRRPAGAEPEWPPRLLPQWDTQLMRHKDKSWLLPRREEEPLVWRKAANVVPSVVARGRIVATWSYRATKKRVRVTVRPLGGWRAGFRQGVEREAAALAAHLERDEWQAAFG